MLELLKIKKVILEDSDMLISILPKAPIKPLPWLVKPLTEDKSDVIWVNPDKPVEETEAEEAEEAASEVAVEEEEAVEASMKTEPEIKEPSAVFLELERCSDIFLFSRLI